MSDQELREAAKRLSRFRSGEYAAYKAGLHGHEQLCDDENAMIQYALAELARRDAEAMERARPITEEALRERGFAPEHDLAWHSGRISVRQYAHAADARVDSTIMLDDNEIIWQATIGQLDALIEALKGGAK